MELSSIVAKIFRPLLTSFVIITHAIPIFTMVDAIWGGGCIRSDSSL